MSNAAAASALRDIAPILDWAEEEKEAITDEDRLRTWENRLNKSRQATAKVNRRIAKGKEALQLMTRKVELGCRVSLGFVERIKRGILQ